MNDQTQILNRNYGAWPHVFLPKDSFKFRSSYAGQIHGWNRKPKIRKIGNKTGGASAGNKTGGGGGGGVYKAGGAGNKNGGFGSKTGGAGMNYNKGLKPPVFDKTQNSLNVRKFYPKKAVNRRFAPLAPRNTTTFLIRAKKGGGIALVSPCPVTPAVLETRMFTPSREVLVDMAKEEWGVNGYGSMNGLIRLRTPGVDGDEEGEEGESSGGSEVEELVEMERRLDHDLSRFEMIYPNGCNEEVAERVNVVEEQDKSHVTSLEEENLTLKERLYLMEKEMVDMQRRLQRLESENLAKDEERDEGSENEGGAEGGVCSEKSIGDGDCGAHGPALIRLFDKCKEWRISECYTRKWYLLVPGKGLAPFLPILLVKC